MNRRDPDGAARDDHDPGRRPPRHAAWLHLPRRARRRKPRLPPRNRHLLRLPRLPDAGRPTASAAWSCGSDAVSRSTTTTPGPSRATNLPTSVFGAVVGVPLTSGQRVIGVIGLASGMSERRFGELEIAALTRFAQLASIALDNANLVRDGPARRALRPDHRTAEPRAPVRPDRPCAVLGPRGRGRVDRPRPPRSRSVQDDQREPRPRVRRPAPGGRRRAAQRLPAARRHGRPLRRRRVRHHPRRLPGPRRGRIAIADRIIEVLRAPFTLGDREWFVNASMGIAIARPGRSDPGRPLPRGRGRARPGEARAGHALHVLRTGDERRDHGAGRARERPPAGARARRAAAPLPADRRSRIRPDRRARGTRPLAAPDARPRAAPVVHPTGRGDRADHPGRALGPGDGLPPGPPVDGRRCPDRSS